MSPEQKSLYIDQLNRTPHQLFEASLVDARPICILDTNILLDLWVFHDPHVEAILKALESHQIRLIGHVETFCEFADVISRTMFKLTSDEQNALLMRWLKTAEVVTEPLSNARFCKDTDDDKFFELAVMSGARFLVSKDKKVLKARGKAKKFGIEVMRRDDFSQWLLNANN